MKKLAVAGALLAAASCVDHRPIRNGLKDESIYLDKEQLTAANPKLGASTDDGWLMKVVVVKAASPNVLGDYAFPGFESDMKYVKLRFREEALQVVDGRKLQSDDPNNPNDDLTTSTELVMMEFPGSHVDIKLRESLDGERTNYLEENTEEPWEKRQKFKVDFEKTSLDPITAMAWFYGEFLHECARPVSQHMVPDSYTWDEDDQFLSFTIEANYDVSVYGGCYDLVSLATYVGTATIQYKVSFYRPGPSSYVTQVIEEKDPVNKKYGTFQLLNLFTDDTSGILSAKSLLQRWNPNRTEPAVFYFAKGFPPAFKPMFEEIKASTNKVLADSGASLRVDFKDYDDGDVEREFGDPRYSFVVWHQDIETTRGLLGYGPSSSDPRTGEVISANLNLYNIGLDYYRFLIENYLTEVGAKTRPEGKKWEEVACSDGETVATATTTENRLSSGLFDEMRRVMNVTEPTGTARDFIPSPSRGKDAFLADYHRTLPEYRYVEPLYNPYVYLTAGHSSPEQYKHNVAVEKDFLDQMGKIMRNQNPFGPVSLHTRDGIKAQLDFTQKMREWKKNHQELMEREEMMLGLKNVYTFDSSDAIAAITRSARRCKGGRFESDTEYRERIIESVVFHVAIHEFGHNMGLRHNFYGSVDAKHMRPDETSASVMDYVASWEEGTSHRDWGGYDAAAMTWIYGNDAARARVMDKSVDFLYCTDEHRTRSPLCTAHDLGITPSQITLNAIERYDWLYNLRNKRSYRTFWDTSFYVGSVYNAVFPILRMWYLAIFDWGGGGVQDVLKRLDQVEGKQVRTPQQYDEIAGDFYNDVVAAVGMTMAFYDAVINQPATSRDYQTKFDPYYGDALQIGIIIDKLFTTFAFMDLQDVSDYNPNIETYVSLYDAPFGNSNFAISQRVLDDMLGANYDTFPWFRYYALAIFADVTNTNLVDSIELKDRIAIRRYENRAELDAEFPGAFEEATRRDNPSQIFVHNGEQYVFTYLPDRSWYLVSGNSRSPVSYQYLREYNEALNTADTDRDNFGLKILLAYYEYFNNFVGF